MGKGDIKTRRGKILNGSYGVSRRRKKNTAKPVNVELEPKAEKPAKSKAK